MFTFKFHSRSHLSLTIATFALAIGAPSSFANAATGDEAATAMDKKMAACKTEMGTAEHLCTRQELSPEQRQALKEAHSRYEAAVAQCKPLPDDQRPICISRAGVPSMIMGTEQASASR